jgi:hypothetical protein
MKERNEPNRAGPELRRCNSHNDRLRNRNRGGAVSPGFACSPEHRRARWHAPFPPRTRWSHAPECMMASGASNQATRGSCPSALRATVRISGGRPLTDDQGYRLSGRVAPDGAVRVIVSAGGQAAAGFGHLSRIAGRGLWRTYSGECSGQWTADPRG